MEMCVAVEQAGRGREREGECSRMPNEMQLQRGRRGAGEREGDRESDKNAAANATRGETTRIADKPITSSNSNSNNNNDNNSTCHNDNNNNRNNNKDYV